MLIADNNTGPILNLPPVTKGLMAAMVAVHVILWVFDQFGFAGVSHWAYMNLGFVPARFTGDMAFTFLSVLSPLSYSFLHGSLFHLGMNMLMLMAFGAGCEKMLGARIMLFAFFAATLGAALFQFVLAPYALYPIIGASGGLSGLFGLMIIFMRRNPGGGLRGLLPIIALWVGVSVLSGFMGSPDGADIAWAAHIGGFFIGIGFGLFLTRKS